MWKQPPLWHVETSTFVATPSAAHVGSLLIRPASPADLITPPAPPPAAQEENATHFNTVAWVHLDPVSGLISPYSGENAELIERAFRESAQSIRVGIILPNGKVLGVRFRL